VLAVALKGNGFERSAGHIAAGSRQPLGDVVGDVQRNFHILGSARERRSAAAVKTVNSLASSFLWRPLLCGAGDEGWLQMHTSGSPTPHNSYQRLRRNCISATSCFQCFGGTASRISQVASALAFISRSTSA